MKPEREFMIKFIVKTWGGGRRQLDEFSDLAIEKLFKQAEAFEPPKRARKKKEPTHKRKPYKAPRKMIPNVKPLQVRKIKI